MLDIIKDILLDGIIDTIKLIPFLFIAFLLIELIEHKLKNKEIISKSGKFGPFIGAILGGIPQCGMATLATNLYVTRIITLGTLISIYLATSDEMIPIMLSEQIEISFLLKIVLIKICLGMVCGFIIDLVYHPKDKESFELCDKEHCHCDHNLFLSSLKHTLNIAVFILIINLVLTSVFEFGFEEYLNGLLLQNTIFGPFITSLIGLIPNCGASVVITELFINNSITLGSLISGLLTGSGVALFVLFKSNKNIKENITIVTLLYLIGAILGLIVDFI